MAEAKGWGRGVGVGEADDMPTSYWHFHREIEPFLMASSGKPAPTFHSWSPFLPTEIPASRAYVRGRGGRGGRVRMG